MYIQMLMYVCMYACMCVCMYVYTDAYVCMYVRVCKCMCYDAVSGLYLRILVTVWDVFVIIFACILVCAVHIHVFECVFRVCGLVALVMASRKPRPV
jgi:hypothetical protein